MQKSLRSPDCSAVNLSAVSWDVKRSHLLSSGQPVRNTWSHRGGRRGQFWQWNINSLFWGVIAPNLQCLKGGVDCLCVSVFQSFTLLQLLWYLQWSHSMQSRHSLRHSRPPYLPSLCLSVDFNISVSLWLFSLSTGLYGSRSAPRWADSLSQSVSASSRRPAIVCC